MSNYNDQGWVPEPDNPKHWSYEDELKMQLLDAGGASDLRPYTTARHNQGASSSCVANSVCKALEIRRNMKGDPTDLSRLAVYYLARELMFPPKTHIDKGTYISHGCDVLRRFGVPPESDWPFDLSKVNHPPSWLAMRKAFTNKITSFFKIYSEGPDRAAEVVRCLANGYPVVFGTVTGSNWHTYQAGQVLSVPAPSDRSGRHATVLVGFDPTEGVFLGENSWGNWGDGGFYKMSPETIADGCSKDFWVIKDD